MRVGRLVTTIVGALVALFGLGAFLAGGVLLWAHGTQRDAGGFFVSPEYDLRADGYAVVTEDMDLAPSPDDWFPGEGDLTFRVDVTAVDASEVFLGVADADELAAYLADVGHDRITGVTGTGRDDVTTAQLPGTAPATAPVVRDLWEASTSGTGTQSLTWDAQRGSWALAIMNADGTAGIAVEATGAVRSDLVLPIAIGLVVAGLVVVGLATVLVVVGASGLTGREDEVPAAAAPARAGTPLVLTGELDPGLSRWQWLVKWLLAIPHVVVLALLWVAFVLLTVVAGVTILFTGRYPRGIFDFNVGVLRWTWRVVYYAFGVLGTDRYPPFSLAPDPAYPAQLDVAYPQQLSRGLVLVKWWLLAIPHYVIVAILTGGAVAWTYELGAADGWQGAAGGGLIGVLVFVAAIALLFTGRYPRGLYDLVMGLQRWVNRVGVYVALMTDEYPPFRLDPGGDDPAAGPARPPTGPPTTDTAPDLVGTATPSGP